MVQTRTMTNRELSEKSDTTKIAVQRVGKQMKKKGKNGGCRLRPVTIDDKARCIFMVEDYSIRHPLPPSDLSVSDEVDSARCTEWNYVGQLEWEKMNARDKAPYLTKAKAKCARVPLNHPSWIDTHDDTTKIAVQRVGKQMKKKEKNGGCRLRPVTIDDEARVIFMVEDYSIRHPLPPSDLSVSDEVDSARCTEWNYVGQLEWEKMNAGDKAPYLTKAKAKYAKVPLNHPWNAATLTTIAV